MNKYSIQIVIKDYAREIDMQKEFIEPLKVGDKLIIADIFKNSLVENTNLSDYEKQLNYFKQIEDETEEPFLMVSEIVNHKEDNWIQLIAVQPLNTIDMYYKKLREEALSNPSDFFRNKYRNNQ